MRGSYPWHAHIKLDGVGVCGGSLLNEFWVITGKYCGVLSNHLSFSMIRLERM